MEAKKNKIEQKLEQMHGNLYLYRGRQVRVIGFTIGDDEVRILNKGNTIIVPIGKIEEELKEFMDMDDPGQEVQVQTEAEKQAVAVFQNDARQMGQLENVLMDNIEKLQKDDKYLDQAKEINDTAKTLLKMSKQKLDMVREMRKAKNMNID